MPSLPSPLPPSLGRLGRRLALASALALVGVFAASWLAGQIVLSPAPTDVGLPPPELQVEDLAFPTATRGTVRGWWSDAGPESPSLLLLHGIASNRSALSRRALLYRSHGYSVLLIDLPSHGQSDPGLVSFGRFESEGVDAAYLWLKARRPHSRLGVDAISLGAAATVYSRHRDDFDALLLESLYSTLDSAIFNRSASKLGPLAKAVHPWLQLQVRLRLGVPTDSLVPLHHMGRIRPPVCLLSGALDPHTHPGEALRLYGQLKTPRQLWIVPSAGHEDFLRLDSTGFARTAIPFFDRWLRS